jgi:hypothetical protein
MHRAPALLILTAALSLVASFAFAREQDIVTKPRDDGGSSGGGLTAPAVPTLSGTLLRSSAATSSWYLYPGACTDRANGTWIPSSTPLADSLNTYGTGGSGPYFVGDLSGGTILWHVVSTSTPISQRPGILSGTRSLWCGLYDPSMVRKVGYPDLTYQILYVNTGAHSFDYTLSLDMNLSGELGFDFLYLIGGGNGAADPLGANRDYFDEILANGTGGPTGDSEHLVSWTGSIRPSTPGATSIGTGGSPVLIAGADDADTLMVSDVSISIDSSHRALYFVFVSEERISNADGLWPYGAGVVLDRLATSDNGSIYSEQVADGSTDSYGGTVIVGTAPNPIVSARVPTPSGATYRIEAGSANPTVDFCAPEKQLSADHFFDASDLITNLTSPSIHAAIQTCTFPISDGTSFLRLSWKEYRDLPRGKGVVSRADYRLYRVDTWGSWRNANASAGLGTGGDQAWLVQTADLLDVVDADSVQVRFAVQCVRNLASNLVTCGSSLYGALYDDLSLMGVTGAGAPDFGILPGNVAQSTFVDGTMTGTNCGSPPCWPGTRGTSLGSPRGIDDNVNPPRGDSLTIRIVSALRPRGMGINWKDAYDRQVNGGRTITHTNGAYNGSYDTPRMIFRLFDPTTRTWSAFDSTRLDANAVHVSGPDTTVIDGEYRVDWPPRDRIGFSLPGGFSINGVTAYSSLAFLPRGTRLQYYWKAVDITGGVAYQFSSDLPAHEKEDLPPLPGSAIKAPDILEFRVLPSVYAPVGSGLLGSSTTTPLLNLDAAYTLWSYGRDPVREALRGLGVRYDYYPVLALLGGGNGVGGGALTGNRPDRMDSHFPTVTDYGIVDSLAKWYRIVIHSSHTRDWTSLDEQDALLVRSWWNHDTGTNAGDRCVLATGDDFFFSLDHPPAGYPGSEQAALSSLGFGVTDASSPWSGATSTFYPVIDDRFAAGSSGPGLASPGAYTYPVDGGCPRPNRFDALTAGPGAGTSLDLVQAAITYPNAQVAGVSRMKENDSVADKDRGKMLGYGYSIQYVRHPLVSPANPIYGTSGVENRMQILYKFLTGCRGLRTGAAGDTGKCWPCPTPTSGGNITMEVMQRDWSTPADQASFGVGTYGPIYPIQARALVTAVGQTDPGPQSPPGAVNALGQNRPNPFNPETAIPFSLARQGRVTIRVYDVAGRVVRTLVDRVEAAGPHVARWNGATDGGNRASSGVYFYRITFPDGSMSAKKLMILR